MRRTRHLTSNLPPSGVPILDTYEEILPLRRQQRFAQISYLYALCPYCDAWRIHGRAPHETKGLIFHASHCVDCPTEDTGYALRIVGPWDTATRRLVSGRYKPRVHTWRESITRHTGIPNEANDLTNDLASDLSKAIRRFPQPWLSHNPSAP